MTHKMNKLKNRIWSLALCASMILSCLPTSAFAENQDGEYIHEHTAECGHIVAVEEQLCTHECGAECAEGCIHVHDDTCMPTDMSASADTDTSTEPGASADTDASTEPGASADTDASTETSAPAETSASTNGTASSGDETQSSGGTQCAVDGCDGAYQNGICSVCGGYQEPTFVSSAGVYEIANAGQLMWFAEKVNGGEPYVNGKLTEDIDATGIAYIGIGKSASLVYSGIFDGNGKKLTIQLDSSQEYLAVFPYISDAEIKNLTVDGEINASNHFVGGIIGRVLGTSNELQNCLSLVTINSTYDGDGTHGGLISIVASGTIMIENCGFAGKIIGPKTTSCGGIVGWTDKNATTNIGNSYVAAYFDLEGNSGNTFGRNPSYVHLVNCYYLNALSDESSATQMSSESFASGEVAYKLGGTWKQTIGEDAYPNFTSKQSVYSYTNCVNTTSYTNDSTIESGSHDYDDNGLCKLDSTHYQPAVLNNGVYEIGNLGQLMWFGSKVNLQEITSHKAKLTADITIDNSVVWTSISLKDHSESSFDGGYKTITFANTKEGSTFGLFGSYNYSTISNLYLKGSITCNQSDLLGAVVNSAYATKIQNVISTVSINNSGSASAGGIAGRFGGKSSSIIQNCAVYADISSTGRAGGLIGENWGGTQYCYVKNSAYKGDVSGSTVGAIMGYNGLQTNMKSYFSNVYYCEKDGIALCGGTYGGTISQTNVVAVTQSQFESGEVTYLLNNSSSSGVWKQTLGTDNVPGFTGGTVYRGYNQCDDTLRYSNSPLNSAAHNYDTDGFCTVCGGYQPCSGEGTAEKPYLTKNAGNLYWFAAQVNDGKTSIHGKLTANITVNPGTFDDAGNYSAKDGETPRQWTPIGSESNQFIGTFDGGIYESDKLTGTYAISGLYYVAETNRVGLFGYVGTNGTVKNAAVKNAYIKGDKYVGGIAGQNNGSITNCSNSGTVITYGNRFSGRNGGIAGQNNGSITNCYNTGRISSRSYFGGVAGYNEGTIANCYNSGTVSFGTDNGGVVGKNYSGTVTNCYYLNTSASCGIGDGDGEAIAKTLTEFNSGEVAYLLNGKTSEGSLAWGQICGEGYPVFHNGSNTVYTFKDCKGNSRYSNTKTEDGSHNYVNGFCTYCDGYEEAKLVDGYYEIDNAGKLYWFAAQVNGGSKSISGKLTANITVNPGTFDESGNYTPGKDEAEDTLPRAWTPIGDESKNYIGTFDGNSKYVSGLYANSENDYIGLFGYVGTSGTAQNVAVKNSYIKGKDKVGGVVGRNHGSVTNCSNSGTVAGASVVGGVVGNNYGSITNCSNSGTVSGAWYVGGVVGDNPKTITNCCNSGAVSVTGDYIGGVAGNSEGSITNCYNFGAVSGTDGYDGGVVGINDSGTVTNCYYLDTCASCGIGSGDGEAAAKTADQFTSGEVTYLLNGKSSAEDVVWKQTLNGKNLPGFTGGIVYYHYVNCTDMGYSNAQGSATPLAHDYKDNNGFCKHCGTYEPCEGEGTAEKPYLIKNAGNLYWFAAEVNGGNTRANAKLMANITVNPGKFDESGNYTVDGAAATPMDWTPIGNSSANGYSATFDGNNKYISGLYTNSEDNFIGLFGVIRVNGMVKNVTVQNSYFKGNEYVGGIVGQSFYGSVANCCNSATVSGTGNYIGGVAGINSSGAITSCYNIGTVTGIDSSTDTDTNPVLCHIGGVVGLSNGEITNCYNTGAVSGETNIGGVAGTNEGTITNCYSTGTVSGKGNAGGVAGYNSSIGTVTNCYYLETCASDGIGGGNSGEATAKTAYGFNSGEVTYLLNGKSSADDVVWRQTLNGVDLRPGFAGGIVYFGYPSCRDGVEAEYTNSKDVYPTKPVHDYDNGFCTICDGYQPCDGEGEDGSPYLIKNGGNLYWFASVATEHSGMWGELAANIKINECILKEDGSLNSVEGVSLRAWTPICPTSDYTYYGSFDGKNFTISGLYFDDSTADYVGLFGFVGANGKVKNVKITDSYFSGKGYVGAIAGYSYYGTFENCASSATVKGCAFDVGGIVGINEYGSIVSCSNAGKVESSYNEVGGVVGRNSYGEVKESSNSGNITSTASGYAYVGGVCGSNDGGYVGDCYNTGNITAKGGYIGGVVGENSGLSSVIKCYNTGDITSTDGVYIGGVCGKNVGSSDLYNVYNTGKVSGKYAYVGGLIGGNEGNISHGYNIGTVSDSPQYIGGILGDNGKNATCEDCYYLEGCATDSNKKVHGGIGGSSDPVKDEDGKTIAATLKQFKSGEITYLLNDCYPVPNEVHPVAWRQTLGTDDFPNFTSEEIVYSGFEQCKDARIYTNDSSLTLVETPHPYVNGFCTKCGAYEPCEGAGTADDPYRIKNGGNLYWFASFVNQGGDNLKANAKLTANIVVNKDVLKKDGSLNSGSFRAWTPIGSDSNQYIGTFDGTMYDESGENAKGNYTISGLYYSNEKVKYVGLFSYVGEGGAVKNVTVKDSYIKSYIYAGGVVGYNKGTITNCSNSGTVSSKGGLGGIVGYNEGTITNCHNTGLVCCTSNYAGGVVGHNGGGEIKNCSNSGAVSGADDVGGVAGYSNETITNCYNTGMVSGTADNVGGVVGRNIGTVTSCYNTGKVSGTHEYVGGVVGATWGIVRNCYNTGTVSGVSSVGGVAGVNCGPIIADCYYLTGCATDGNATVQYGIGNETKGSSTEDADGVTTGKTGAEFASGEVAYLLNGSKSDDDVLWKQTIGKDESPNFTGEIVYCYTDCQGNPGRYGNDRQTDGDHYCDADGFCIAIKPDGTPCGAYQPCVEENGVYRIKNIGNLYWFAEKVNGGETSISGLVVADIVVNKDLLNENGELNGNGSNFRTWTPIGSESIPYRGSFTGAVKFDGSGENLGYYTISGLYVDNSDTSNTYVGLFGYINAATIQGINVADAYFESSSMGESARAYVGGIVGYVDNSLSNSSTRIIGCTSSGTFVATAHGDSSDVSTSTYSLASAGGIVGYVLDLLGTVRIDGCTSSGTVEATAHGDSSNAYSGGIAGFVNANGKTVAITNCSNFCTAEATAHGDSSRAYSGGIAGYITEGSEDGVEIMHCYNTGSVTATAHGGYSSDSSSPYAYAGGLVGNSFSMGKLNIKHCYNTGDVSGTANGGSSTYVYSGGLVGYGGIASKATLKIENCYNAGDVTGTANGSYGRSYCGGLAGRLVGSNITLRRCYWLDTSAADGIAAGGSNMTTENVVAKTLDQFKTGEVTWLLNGERSEGTDADPIVWYQTLGKDDFPKFAGKTVYYDSGKNPQYYNDTTSDEVVSVTITWTDMSFSYNKGTWNTDTMTWEGGGWVADTDRGTVTVTNTGEVDLTAQFDVSFTNDSLGISASFTESDVLLEDKKLKVLAGKEKTVSVKLTGSEPPDYMEEITIGQVTITLSTE